jgi:hypothetical protein
MNKSQILDIIHDTCLKLNRPDLVGQIKIAQATTHQFLYETCRVYGYVHANFPTRKLYKKIVLTKSFDDLTEQGQIDCIRHETVHIIDLSQETQSWDDVYKYQGHGPSFKNLAAKLNLPEFVPQADILIKRELSQFQKRKWVKLTGCYHVK